MNSSQYSELDKLISEYEDDLRNIREEKLIMKNYPKVFTMSVASLFEYYIKNKCKDFLDNPKLPIATNYLKIENLKGAPKVDKMYAKLEAYNDNGVEHLEAEQFYALFNGLAFKSRVNYFFVNELQSKLQLTEEKINNLTPLLGEGEKYDSDYAKYCSLKDELERCTFEDAEKAFLSIKLRRNRVAHDYINGLSDTFSDIQKFYNVAILYVIALEKSIEELTNT